MYGGKPNKLPGPGATWPASPPRRLPSFLSQRSWEPYPPGHVAAPQPSAPGQNHAGRPGTCASRILLSLTGVPAKMGSRTDSTTPAPIILRRRHRLQGSLIEGQHRPHGPRDTTGEGVNRCPLPCRNDGCPCAPSITPAGVTRHPLSGLGMPPLSGHAVLWAEATQERHKVALQIRDVDPVG